MSKNPGQEGEDPPPLCQVKSITEPIAADHPAAYANILLEAHQRMCMGRLSVLGCPTYVPLPLNAPDQPLVAELCQRLAHHRARNLKILTQLVLAREHITRT